MSSIQLFEDLACDFLTQHEQDEGALLWLVMSTIDPLLQQSTRTYSPPYAVITVQSSYHLASVDACFVIPLAPE